MVVEGGFGGDLGWFVGGLCWFGGDLGWFSVGLSGLVVV